MRENHLYTSTETKAENRVHVSRLKVGGGSSSGLGEFWNIELAKYPALSLLTPALLAGLRFLDWEVNNMLRLSVLLENESSSSDMLKTPSLGVRR